MSFFVLQVVRPVDARIHFALNCGAASCPAIKLYSTDTLEEGLTGAAEAFCASEVAVDVAAKKVRSHHWLEHAQPAAERIIRQQLCTMHGLAACCVCKQSGWKSRLEAYCATLPTSDASCAGCVC